MTAAKTIGIPEVTIPEAPRRTLTDQIIEAVVLHPGITARDLATLLMRDTAAVKGALNMLALDGRLRKERGEGARPQNLYYPGHRVREVWANGEWRVVE